MSVQLEFVVFNIDFNSAQDNAFNIRKNKTHYIARPEWQRAKSVKPEDSPAAYAIKETKGNTIKIDAEFYRTDPNLKKIWIRAVDPADPPAIVQIIPTLWLKNIVNMISGFFLRVLAPLGVVKLATNILGEVQAQQVSFNSGKSSGLVRFALKKVKLSQYGVGSYTVTWHWQYAKNKSGPWKDFAKSRHRVYSVLEIPSKPWVQTPFDIKNIHLPWTDALDFATSWAQSAKHQDTAAEKITKSIYELGVGPSSIFEYDCKGGGGDRYGYRPFNCSAFIERLQGKPGKGRFVNCTDCAHFVYTLSNLLGCDLSMCYISTNTSPRFFYLNPIRSIGFSSWEKPCMGWEKLGFEYHMVAWKGSKSNQSEVYDACLQVDGDADPTKSPHTPQLVAKMRFGNPGDKTYLDRLVAPLDPKNKPNRSLVSPLWIEKMPIK